jgi:hypothetical protein
MSGSYNVRVTGPDLDVSVQIVDSGDLEIVAALMQKIGRAACPTPVTGISHAFAEHEGEVDGASVSAEACPDGGTHAWFTRVGGTRRYCKKCGEPE